jgi:membrane protease subunit (stomatin/prohibitin family)
MVLGWFSKETKSMYVARPAERAEDLIFLHPDKSIPRGSKLTVRSDECVLFFREGKYIGKINPGTTVQLDTANIPFLGHLLIDKFTDANHFICEVFFVRLSEKRFDTPRTDLGQYKDLNSANVIAMGGSMSYTVKVTDPARLVIELGGQHAGAELNIETALNGRMLNHLRAAVGQRAQRMPILNVVSNVDADALSEDVKNFARNEFMPLGIDIGRVFDMALALDEASFALLREFGKQESQLALQAKGMQLATNDGFAEFNMIQAQRSALEGLGKGLESGNGPLILGGMNLGGNLTGISRPPQRSAPPSRPSGVLSNQSAFFVVTERGEQGPYSARQVALSAISKGQTLGQLLIRSTEDAEGVSFPADAEPQILNEYQRRLPPGSQQPVNSPGVAPAAAATIPAGAQQAFNLAFDGAASNGDIASSELATLINLSVTFGLAPNADAAEAHIRQLAQLRGVTITA